MSAKEVLPSSMVSAEAENSEEKKVCPFGFHLLNTNNASQFKQRHSDSLIKDESDKDQPNDNLVDAAKAAFANF